MTRRVEIPALYPPREGENELVYTDRILAAARWYGTFRQCSIGRHEECSSPGECRCLCHHKKASIYSVEGYPDESGCVITRAAKGRHFWPPVDGEPEGMWACWVYALSKKDAVRRAEIRQTAVVDGAS